MIGSSIIGDRYYMAYEVITLSFISFLFIKIYLIWLMIMNKIDLLLFLCDVCNEIYEHMQLLNE